MKQQRGAEVCIEKKGYLCVILWILSIQITETKENITQDKHHKMTELICHIRLEKCTKDLVIKYLGDDETTDS